MKIRSAKRNKTSSSLYQRRFAVCFVPPSPFCNTQTTGVMTMPLHHLVCVLSSASLFITCFFFTEPSPFQLVFQANLATFAVKYIFAIATIYKQNTKTMVPDCSSDRVTPWPCHERQHSFNCYDEAHHGIARPERNPTGRPTLRFLDVTAVKETSFGALTSFRNTGFLPKMQSTHRPH